MSTPGSHKLWYLSEFKLFSELKPEDIEEISGVVTHKKILKNDAIYCLGDEAATIYLLIQGKVRISQISDDGRSATLAILTPGDIFGELALLKENPDDSYHDDMAEAIDDCVVCLISKKDFEQFLIKKPALNMRVMKLIGLRLRRVENQIYNLIFKDVGARLESLLHSLAEDFGVPHPEGTLINIELTHQDIGSLINATRQTVSIFLGNMKKLGTIKTQGRHIILSKKLAPG